MMLLIEGSAHPADLGWNACIPIIQYNRILNKYTALRGEIERKTRMTKTNML